MKLQNIAAIAVGTLALVAVASARPTPPPMGPGGITGPLPDLRPIAPRVLTGTVSIKNYGPGPAAASIATLVCQKQGVARGGHCPEPGPIPEFTDPAYPNAVVVHVPPLAAGHVFNFKLPFWDALVWSSGDYDLTLTADAGTAVPE